jgi:hypothetical protein
MNDQAEEACRQLFLRLVTLGEGSEDTRRRVPRSELAPLADARAMDGVIEAFGRHRLLSFDRDPATREPTVEIAHEAMLSAWTRLRGWIADAREDIRTQRQLMRAVTEWATAGRDGSFLLRGARLAQIASWAEATNLALSSNEHEYLRESIAERDEERTNEDTRRDHERALERRSVRRSRALVAVFAVAALVAASLTFVANRESGRAEHASRVATARELAAAAMASLDDDVERSLLLAIRAVDTTRSVDGTVLAEAQEALHAAIQADRVVTTLEGGPVVRFSPDASRILTPGKAPGTAIVYDAGTGQRIMTLRKQPAYYRLNHVNYSPDGRLISTSGGGVDSVVLWDAMTGDRLGRLTARLESRCVAGPSSPPTRRSLPHRSSTAPRGSSTPRRARRSGNSIGRAPWGSRATAFTCGSATASLCGDILAMASDASTMFRAGAVGSSRTSP